MKSITWTECVEEKMIPSHTILVDATKQSVISTQILRRQKENILIVQVQYAKFALMEKKMQYWFMAKVVIRCVVIVVPRGFAEMESLVQYVEDQYKKL